MAKKFPRHIGIIPDGNRRWAVEHGKKKQDGYEYGLLPGLSLLRMAKKLGIEEITYYGFTVDNCKRPSKQVKSFQKACVDAVNLLRNEDVDLLVVGNCDSKCFPSELSIYTKRLSKEGTTSERIKVNLLVNYGWKWDLSNINRNGQPLSSDISKIDLIIRWGGMRRLSGFLPIQSVYADFFVVDHLWPDYVDEDLIEAVEWYKKQDVTLGG